MASQLPQPVDRFARWIVRHPLRTCAAVAGAGLVCWAVYKVLNPAAPFKEADDEGESKGVRFKSDDEYPAQVGERLAAVCRGELRRPRDLRYLPAGGLVRAIRELGAEGIFREKEARAITREFVDLARTATEGASVDSNGDPVLSRDACRGLFAQIGVRDARVADSIFER
jgi:hypothetical protein